MSALDIRVIDGPVPRKISLLITPSPSQEAVSAGEAPPDAAGLDMFPWAESEPGQRDRDDVRGGGRPDVGSEADKVGALGGARRNFFVPDAASQGSSVPPRPRPRSGLSHMPPKATTLHPRPYTLHPNP